MSVPNRIMSNKVWNEIITNILNSDEFNQQMQSRGFYLSPEYKTFKEYLKNTWGVISTQNTATFLSLDFWQKQLMVLRNKNYYLIRTGKGSFAILDDKIFSKPYLNLNIGSDIIELSEDIPQGYEYHNSVFKENLVENTGLEQLRFNGTYDRMIQLLTGKKQSFHVGVRGNTTSTFDIYLKRSNSNIIKIRTYSGQVELDYTLWTTDSVFLFEAKKIGYESAKRYLDIGWHKIAYAAAQFLNHAGLKIYPVYFLRNPKQILLFVFPQFKFHENGIILNDKLQMTPSKVFVVDL